MSNTPFVVRWATKHWMVINRPSAWDAARGGKWEIQRLFRIEMRRNMDDLKPRGITRNRCGSNNRRWRRHVASLPKPIFSTFAYDLVP